MTSFLVHVGPHKTGTTYLQLRLAAIRKHLRSRGVAYPAIWSSAGNEPSHRKLVVALREARSADLRAQFDAMVSDKPEHVLISAEGISHLEQPALELLASLMQGRRVTLVFYVRRWSELLPSLWQERVKHGADETFPQFLAMHLADPIASATLNLTHALNRYAALFGRTSLVIVSYSNVCDSGLDLAEHFLATFLPEHTDILSEVPQLPNPKPNRSLPARDIELIRALNGFSARDGLPESSQLRDWYFRQSSRFDVTALRRAIEENLATVHLSDASEPMRTLHQHIYRAYGDLLIQPSRPDLLFAPRAADISFAQPRYLSDPKARSTLDEIYAAYRAELQ